MTHSNDNRAIKSVAVFAGSKPGNEPIFRQATEELGTLLGQNGYDVIYGGGDFGLMGIVARTAQAAGSKVKGLIVRLWANAGGGPAIPGVDEKIVENREERKAVMRDETQASILLPGGIGSWDEILDIMAWQDEQRYVSPGKPPRPIIVLNTGGVYNHLKGLIEDGIRRGFVYKESENLVRFVDTPSQAAAILNDYNSPARVNAPEFKPSALS
jgi:uncharacterized protein (TIGR00730 family)